MQRDPSELSIPLDGEHALTGFPEFEETGELPQIPPQPAHLAAASVPGLQASRSIWRDDAEIIPVMGAGYADPETLDTVITPSTGRGDVATSAKVSRAQQARRRIATGCSALCVALLLLALSVTALVYLRPIVEQPGSGQANGVEVHSTPELTPLAQVQSPQATATLQATATHGSGRRHDPKATPTQGRAPTPTAPTGGKPKSTATPTPVIVPTVVPTTGPTPVPTTTQPTPTTAPAPPTPTNPPPPPTATPRPPTATVTPGHGTLTFTDQSERWSNPADLAGCPAGCTFVTKPVSASTHESTTRNTSGRTTQTQLSGSFDLAGRCSNGPGNPCNLSLTVASICGDGICCPINVTIGGGEEVNGVGCTVNTSSPTFIAAGALDGQKQRVGPRGTLTVSWTNSAFTGNGGRPYVSQADCNNGLSVVRNEAASWIASTWSSASSGDVIARSYTESETGASCFPGVGTIASSFTASLNVSITNGLVYNPYGPINAAKAELTAAAPGAPWNWIYTSPPCYPRTISVSGNDVTATCQDSGLAVWTWSASDKAGLAQAVAGQTLQSAQSICNGWVHVAGNCVATSDASNHMPPPSNWQAIVISPQNPGDPFSASVSASAGAIGAVVRSSRLSSGAVAGLYVLLTLLGLLLLGAGGIGFLAHRRRPRKAV